MCTITSYKNNESNKFLTLPLCGDKEEVFDGTNGVIFFSDML